QTITGIVTGAGFNGVITVADVQTLINQTGDDLSAVMLDLTAVAALFAMPPISNFFVGAVVAGGSGNLYFGCNMEYAGQPLSFCSHGEQDATVNAWIAGNETSITSLAVNAAPCGYCRQYLYETVSAQTLTIILPSKTAAYQTMPLTDLLPLAFGPQDLGIKGGLLDPQANGLSVSATNPAVLAGLAAANACYAPYTKAYSGIGLLMNDGKTFAGPLSENAAYNPSQSPLEAALFLMNMAGYSYGDISEVALVEAPSPVVSQLAASAAVLSSVAPSLSINYVTATTS
ncbi:MAG TPA: cytidine deaminase, partial [Thermoanaerobaculia bacterium]